MLESRQKELIGLLRRTSGGYLSLHYLTTHGFTEAEIRQADVEGFVLISREDDVFAALDPGTHILTDQTILD